MFGVIYLWRVKADKREEHGRVMRETLRAERECCPEVLLNLTLGLSDDGTCAEIQVYADDAAHRAFPERVKSEVTELQRLWSLFGDLCEPDGWRTFRFERTDFLDESFVRDAVSLTRAPG